MKNKKEIKTQFWLSKNGAFPLNFDDFIPLLHIVSFASKKIGKFKDFLSNKKLPDKSFPLKAVIPLFMSVNASIKIQNYTPL